MWKFAVIVWNKLKYKDTSFPTFCRILEALRVEWQNLMPRFGLTTEPRNGNINLTKYFISLSGIEPTTNRFYCHIFNRLFISFRVLSFICIVCSHFMPYFITVGLYEVPYKFWLLGEIHTKYSKIDAYIHIFWLRWLSKSKSNNFVENKKLHASFFERQVIYHQFTKVSASDLRRTGARNSAGLIFLNQLYKKTF